MTSRAPHTRTRLGFTLLEILLVVLVVAVVAGAFVPMAIESVEGARMRSALRDTVAVNKYARARAVLDRAPTAVLYHADVGELQLVRLPARRAFTATDLTETPPPRLGGEPEIGSTSASLELIRTRSLPNGMRILDVEGAAREEDTFFVVYTPSGMTDPHTVRLEDNRGDRSSVIVNGITGDIRLDDA